ncbi:hypothetical protein BESB_064950 [Besnoitia besnoiti]|uniref:DUF4460 domain-containing protein n=1 Tax=Besnoitia besnoiti TaxID=94643 RepID=A0A2A9MB76_BESBE|nr:hypothetical protein BESB_064950 [Besnoitia besnoiti]PFH34464.1 hypothetical protein BESB_064950 [Besnoitia besnoiti]
MARPRVFSEKALAEFEQAVFQWRSHRPRAHTDPPPAANVSPRCPPVGMHHPVAGLRSPRRLVTSPSPRRICPRVALRSTLMIFPPFAPPTAWSSSRSSFSTSLSFPPVSTRRAAEAEGGPHRAWGSPPSSLPVCVRSASPQGSLPPSASLCLLFSAELGNAGSFLVSEPDPHFPHLPPRAYSVSPSNPFLVGSTDVPSRRLPSSPVWFRAACDFSLSSVDCRTLSGSFFSRLFFSSSSRRGTTKSRSAAKARRGSLRRELRFFLLCVHPDRTMDFPEEARRANATALSELNAYIDRIECLLTTLPLSPSSPIASSPLSDPFLAKKLMFFVPYKTVTGRVLDGRVRPVYVHLNSISMHPSRSEVENLAENLCCSLVKAVEAPVDQFDAVQNNPLFGAPGNNGEDAGHPERLLTSKHAGRDRLQALWDAQTEEIMFKAALYQPDEKHTRRVQLMNREFRRQEASLVRRAMRIKNRRVRKQRLAAVAEKAESKVREKFGPDPPEPPAELAEHLGRVAVAEAGCHPDFVFFQPSLSPAQKEEALRRLCGGHLEKEAHRWLLQNLLKELRRPPTPVPLIIGTEFAALIERGLALIPFDFDVWQLADFLEEHLDAVRQGRTKVRDTPQGVRRTHAESTSELLDELKDVYR